MCSIDYICIFHQQTHVMGAVKHTHLSLLQYMHKRFLSVDRAADIWVCDHCATIYIYQESYLLIGLLTYIPRENAAACAQKLYCKIGFIT